LHGATSYAQILFKKKFINIGEKFTLTQKKIYYADNWTIHPIGLTMGVGFRITSKNEVGA